MLYFSTLYNWFESVASMRCASPIFHFSKLQFEKFFWDYKVMLYTMKDWDSKYNIWISGFYRTIRNIIVFTNHLFQIIIFSQKVSNSNTLSEQTVNGYFKGFEFKAFTKYSSNLLYKSKIHNNLLVIYQFISLSGKYFLTNCLLHCYICSRFCHINLTMAMGVIFEFEITFIHGEKTIL